MGDGDGRRSRRKRHARATTNYSSVAIAALLLRCASSSASAFVNSPTSRFSRKEQKFVRETLLPSLSPSAQPSIRSPRVPGVALRVSLSRTTTSSAGVIRRRPMEFDVHESISSIPSDLWDGCLYSSSSPFLRHSWLRCLEESGCASPETGWVPRHLSILIDGRIAGFVPMYVKSHSMGEFIFDTVWANAATRNGIEYYPKLLVGVPFTPVTGERMILRPEFARTLRSREDVAEVRMEVGRFLKRFASSNGMSGVHLNFMTDEEATDIAGPILYPDDERSRNEPRNRFQGLFGQANAAAAASEDEDNGYLRRTSIQYHWSNRNAMNENEPYRSFEEYLSRFKSKRRIAIRRERRRVSEEERIRVDAVVGHDILKYEGLVERMYELYASTVDRMIMGRQYLTLEFFQRLSESDFVTNLCFMCARRDVGGCGEEFKVEDVFAGTFNIVKDKVFYGRYWGCLPGKEVKDLHFEVCYWSAIEHCIRNGFKRMEPGAGGGDYKFARGFDAAPIHSAHYICNPALRKGVSVFLDRETQNNLRGIEYLLTRSALKSGA